MQLLLSYIKADVGRKVKKIIIGIFLLVVACVIGAVVYVMNTDWISQHKDKITEQFYNATGKVMQFDGDITFKFLPSPYLRANNVKIFNSEDTQTAPIIEMRTMDAVVALKPLLKGEFEVTNMEMSGVKFNIDWDSGFSWQSDLSPDQRQVAENSRFSLNNVMVKDAELFFKSAENHLDFHLTNLNGEISAESMFGPFRMEGNYLNGGAPEGFALTIGRLSENSTTAINLAVTHPASNSYFRFDGSFQTQNKVINGNVIIESPNLSKFAYANLPSLDISEEYSQKIALGFDLALNPQKAVLSNVVIKYGDNTSGSGNLQIPLNDDKEKITTSFNFTDLDLNVFSNLLDDTLRKCKEQNSLPKWNLNGEVRALRVHYMEQQLKNLALMFNMKDGELILKNSSVILPGNTLINADGEIYSADDGLFYKADLGVKTDNLSQTLKWLNINLPQPSPSIYKNMNLNTKMSGNFERVQFSPFKLVLDKSTVNGEIGLVWGDKKDIMLSLQADAVNFDNYINPLPEEEKNKSWLERVGYRFNKLSVLNDIDMVLDLKSDLVIYENMPFEKIALKGNVLNKVAELDYFTVDKVANTKLNLSGKVSGFGGKAQVEELKYDIKSADVTSLINKLELKVPNLDYKRFNSLSLLGTVNGSIDNMGINTDIQLGALNLNYVGQINVNEEKADFDGDIKLKHSDFNQLISNLQVAYQPQGANLGSLQAQGHIKGNKDNLDVSSLDVNIGQTNATGNLLFELVSDRPNILTKLKINKLDVEKFLPKSSEQSIAAIPSENITNLLARPNMSKEIFDFTPYKNADIHADMEVTELTIDNNLFKEAKFNLELAKNQLAVRNFEGLYNNTPLQSEVLINMEDKPTINWNGRISDAGTNNFNLGGAVYQIREGTFSTSWNFNSSAESRYDFWKNLGGNADFKATDPLIKGINTKVIYDDLLKREVSDGLSESVRDALKGGSTQFKELSGRINIADGKFTLSDAKAVAENLNISSYGEGNFADWTMNMVFNAKFIEPQYLPEFSFIFKDDMSSPTIDVNVSSLFKFYKAKIDQKEAEAEKVIETARAERKDVASEQKQIADNMVGDVRNGLEKDIDAKLEKAFSDKSKERYVAQKQEVANILASLIEKMAAFDHKELADDDLIKMDEINKEAKNNISRITNAVADIYYNDLKMQAESYDNQIVEEYNQLKKMSFAYNSSLQKFADRLVDITTQYTLDGDLELQRQKSEIEAQISAIKKMHNQLEELKQTIISGDVKAYEQYNPQVAKIISDLAAERENLQKQIDKLDAEENQKLDNIIEVYRNEIETMENERLIKENTGSISVKKTGQTVKVSRELSEIKNANEAVSNEEVRVLDFTKPKVQPQSKPQSSVGVVKKGGNLIAK